MLLYADALNPRTRTILVARHGLDGEPHASCRRSASSSGSPASACARSRPRRSRACATPPCALARRRRHPRRLLARPTRHAPTCDTVGAAPRRQGMRGPRDAANGTDGPEGARTTPRPPPASGRSAFYALVRAALTGPLAGLLTPLAHASAPALPILAAILAAALVGAYVALAVLLARAVLRVVRPRLDGRP